MPNPFFFGPKITNPKYFVGRKTELKRIFSFLETEHTGQIQHVSVIGERRIGKSSLLYHLTQVNEKYLRDSENYHLLYLDLQDPRCHTVSGLLGYILEELHLSRPTKVTLERFYEIIEKEREKKGMWNILLMDEFEKLTERPKEFTDDFYDTLRSLGNNNLLGIVTASQHTLRDLADQEKLTSPFFNIFHQIELGEFSKDEAQALLNRGRTSDQKFNDEDCKNIIKIAGYHPARLQIVGDILYRQKESGAKINWKEIEQKAKNEPAFDANLNHRKKNLFLSFWHWLSYSLPLSTGHTIMVIIGRGEHTDEKTDRIIGSIALLVLLAIIIGLLPYPLVTKYIRRLSELFFQ